MPSQAAWAAWQPPARLFQVQLPQQLLAEQLPVAASSLQGACLGTAPLDVVQMPCHQPAVLVPSQHMVTLVVPLTK